MAPKTNLNATKLASVLSYFHNSCTAHTIKDLEKSLPSAAGINSMQVKDYVTALVDERQVRMEKIGAGNWYWAFTSEARKEATDELARVEGEAAKLAKQVDEMKEKIREAEELRATEDEGQRNALLVQRDELNKEVEELQEQLAELEDGSPEELERKGEEVARYKAKAEMHTDRILEMERWLSERVDREQMLMLKRELYGKHFDEEDEGLRELDFS